jgi:hypothetical protein
MSDEHDPPALDDAALERLTLAVGRIDARRIARDEEWRGELGELLHSIELMVTVGASGDDIQMSLHYAWDPNEIDLQAPEIEAVDGKVTPESAVAMSRWVDQTTPVWKLLIEEDPYDEATEAPSGHPVLVVALTERRLDDLVRRLWLHPWYRALVGIDRDVARLPGLAKRAARERRRVEADLAERAARAWRRGEANPENGV